MCLRVQCVGIREWQANSVTLTYLFEQQLAFNIRTCSPSEDLRENISYPSFRTKHSNYEGLAPKCRDSFAIFSLPV